MSRRSSGVVNIESIASTLVGRVITGGAREDEDDDRQEVLALQRLEQFAAARGAKGRRRRADFGPFHFGPGRNFRVDFIRLSMRRASSESRCPSSRSTISTLRLTASHDRQVVVQLDRSLLLHDDRCRPADLGEPLPDEVGVADSRREGDEAHGRRREDDDLFPHAAAKGILEIVDLVEDDETQRRELVRLGEQHVAQHLGRHDDDFGAGVDRDVAGEQSRRDARRRARTVRRTSGSRAPSAASCRRRAPRARRSRPMA